MQESVSERTPRNRTGRTGLALSIAIVSLVAVGLTLTGLWENHRRRTQMQNDPRVARVWVAGTTFGLHHQLQRGASLQRWLNEHHISLLGDYVQVQSQYANDRGSAEIWFNYESYLVGQPDLECHRVSPDGTAFIDDLGQPYHGFLDIHGKTVGVYRPGYDHSARELHCVLHWMPRRPASPNPVSRPMAFTIPLPRFPRILPPAAGLPRAVTARKNGVSVTIEAARLGPFKPINGAIGQRDITFHLKVEGGLVASDNVANEIDLSVPDGAAASRIRSLVGAAGRSRVGGSGNLALQAQRQMMAFTNATDASPMILTDPYGFPLIVPGQSVTPLISKETLQSARRGEGMVWVVPVQNAGKGTDVVRIHLDVLPKEKGSEKSGISTKLPIPFDLDVPVQTGDEI